MRVAFHLIWALLLGWTVPAHAQQPAAAGGGTAYTVFFRGVPIGSETVRMTSDGSGTAIRSDGRFGPPLNVTLRAAEIRYSSDWIPVSASVDGSFNGSDSSLRTTFQNGTAATQGSDRGAPVTETQPVTGKVVVLPAAMFTSYAGLAMRLATDPPGTALRAFTPLASEFEIRVTTVQNEQAQVGTTVFPIRRYEMIFRQPGGDVGVTLSATAEGALVRVAIPSQALEIVRGDVASPNSRTGVHSNPGDEALTVPLVGFNLGATITHPANAAAGAMVPAVVLLGAAGVNDRDGVLNGVPTLAQLAGALADAGFLTIRYDKRGYGQSGGRAESATIQDQAEDARAVAKWLTDRKDVDDKRIAIVGHSEGAMVALLAASRDKRFAAVVSIAGPSTSGAEQFLEQQKLALDASTLPAAEKEKRLALQRQVQQAVLSGKGWEGIPANVRRDADTPWFQSLLAYDPAKVLDDLRQPRLIVHGAIDQEVPAAHADRLAALARQKSKSKAIDLVIVRGVNHLLVPAVTGSTNEYGTLTDRNVSKDVTSAVTGWLTRTLSPASR
jgi:pimeloyl-ACP methyl ester carboxylesterase